jgi:hypothetical protein
MSSNRCQRTARELLLPILQKSKIGAIVASLHERKVLGSQVLAGVAKMLVANGLLDRKPRLYLDTGIPCSAAATLTFLRATDGKCVLLVEQDSRRVLGLQLADLAAHYVGSMLLDGLGILKKTVKAGPNDGYRADEDLDLGFAIWATVRRSFFMASQPFPDPVSGDPIGNLEFDVANYGLYVSDGCRDTIRSAALDRFGKFYLGCRH